MKLEYATFQLILFHYPMEHWRRMKSGAIHLHGHSHNRLKYNLDAI
jgi:calcineurin-like phosphoesterase family protein